MLALRLEVATPLNPRQRGFIKNALGCLENRNILRSLIEDGKRHSAGVAVALLDHAKAFDKVPYDLLVKGLKRFRAPPRFLGAVISLYAGAQTYFKVQGSKTGNIVIEAGIRQGCPMSPILFNISMDPLFCLLETAGAGYKVINNCHVASLTYADDTAVISEGLQGLTQNLAPVEKFCGRMGLAINLKKSFAFIIKQRENLHIEYHLTTRTVRPEHLMGRTRCGDTLYGWRRRWLDVQAEQAPCEGQAHQELRGTSQWGPQTVAKAYNP